KQPSALFSAAKYLDAAGRPADAEPLLHQSVALAEMAPARYPGQVYLPLYQWLQAQGLTLRGRIRFEAGREAEAEEDYLKAAALFAKWTPAEFQTFSAYPDLACLEQARGELLWSRGDKQAARDAFRRAEGAWRKVTNPKNARRHGELA